MREEILKIRNGQKMKGKHFLLKDICFELSQGESIGIISDDQNLKQILGNLLNGEERFSDGKIYFQEYRTDIIKAQKQFRKTVMTLDPRRKVAKDFFVEDMVYSLNSDKKMGYINLKKTREELSKCFQEFSCCINPKTKVEKLSIFERCQLELIRAYKNGYSIIIISDIFYLLNDEESAVILDFIFRLRMYNISFIFMDQSEEIMFENSDRIYIMNEGIMRYILYPEEYSKEQLELVLSNRQVKDYSKMILSENPVKKEIIKIEKENLNNGQELNFSLYSGEILSIQVSSVEQGKEIIQWMENNLEKQLISNKKIAVGYLYENAMQNQEGFFKNMTVIDNLLLMTYQKTGNMIDRKKYKNSLIKEAKDFFTEDILKKKVYELDFLQKQFLTYYLWYLYNPLILVCEYPFAGTDIYMREVTYNMMRKISGKGVGIIVITMNKSEGEWIGDCVIRTKKVK